MKHIEHARAAAGGVGRIATVDVGTNTALLLVADLTRCGLDVVEEQARFVRLGEGVDAARRISAAAMERLRGVLLEYRAIAETLGATQIVVTGTSASRDAENRADLIDYVRRETGLGYEILSGEDEARWSFAGALSATSLEGTAVAVDIGGGSTEVTLGRKEGRRVSIDFHASMNVGAVRLTERLFAGQPPSAEGAKRASGEIARALEAARLPSVVGVPLVGVAGTVSALAAIAGGVEVLSRADVRLWSARLLQMTYDEVMALDPSIMRGRADVFPAGVLILDGIMEEIGAGSCLVGSRDLRHGLALRAAAEPARRDAPA